ncbi:hypothetical protein F8C76_02315 [Flagellimonas olearia]|uniref:Uncharacterized protein n=1 Tax=Flagellimonas olearia TaxID=552546 RepID=A0A6I1E9G3_9FLAO|nr:hypothetical protein [Allomuricauda olearia]KAB7530364.1 hypothetical protein F8C76_02315 [Allomuricauda olearia]
MIDMTAVMTDVDWKKVPENPTNKWHVTVSKILTDKRCERLTQTYSNKNVQRKMVLLEHYCSGLGEHGYFDHPLPNTIGLHGLAPNKSTKHRALA